MFGYCLDILGRDSCILYIIYENKHKSVGSPRLQLYTKIDKNVEMLSVWSREPWFESRNLCPLWCAGASKNLMAVGRILLRRLNRCTSSNMTGLLVVPRLRKHQTNIRCTHSDFSALSAHFFSSIQKLSMSV